jgi:hypothetical protein
VEKKIDLVRRLVAVARGACVFLLLIQTPVSLADNGRDYYATYRINSVQPGVQGMTGVALTVHLHNVSGGAINRAVLEIDGIPPAPPAQTFPLSFSLADRGDVLLSGTILIAITDLNLWKTKAGYGPKLVVVGTDSAGTVGRHAVEVTRANGVAQ